MTLVVSETYLNSHVANTSEHASRSPTDGNRAVLSSSANNHAMCRLYPTPNVHVSETVKYLV